jgi:ribosomal protein S18 acetylase RimI-like enzyme
MSDNKTQIRRLVPGDEAMVDAFLAPHTASSMFLRSNMRLAGLAFEGKRLQGIYLGTFGGGELLGVIAHYQNGNVVVQAPHDASKLAQAIISESTLPLKGLLGPWDQAAECVSALGLSRDAMQVSYHELLFDLSLANMRVPETLIDGALKARRCTPNDFDVLVNWHVQYDVEALNVPASKDTYAENLESLNRSHEAGQQYVLECDSVLVAMCTFTAELDDTVQLGGVYTPPDLRGRGYGRAMVAGALRIAQQEGRTKAVLFTDDNNIAAQTPYRAIGFQEIGEFAIHLFGYDARILIKDSALSPRSNDRPVHLQP